MSRPTKRRRVDEDDVYDDCGLNQRQLLPVARLPGDFSGIPSDGAEYLFLVRREANKLSHTTRVENPYTPPPRPSPLPRPAAPPMSHILPSEVWREAFLAGFKNLRKNTAQPTIGVPLRPSTDRVMPDKNHSDLWREFIAGKPRVQWDPPKKPRRQKGDRFQYGMRAFAAVADDASGAAGVWRLNDEGEMEFSASEPTPAALPTPSSTPEPQIVGVDDEIIPEVNTLVAREPTPELLSKIDHKFALKLLMHISHWITLHIEDPISQSLLVTDSHARWAFAVLTRLDDHMDSEDMSTLRNVARSVLRLIKLRSGQRLDGSLYPIQNQMDVSSCWMVMTVVAGHWGQRDLWTDAEQVLSV